jgi:hypothetical protein
MAVTTLAAACGGGTGLAPAVYENFVDTFDLYALRGTPLNAPSYYDVVNARASRPDQGEEFDFAFDLSDEGEAEVLPAPELGVGIPVGLRLMDDAFTSIDQAPLEDYSDRALTVTVETVFVVQSRLSRNFCGFLGQLPRYGKFRVLAIDSDARTITFEALVNQNCGYRSLEPGLPTR